MRIWINQQTPIFLYLVCLLGQPLLAQEPRTFELKATTAPYRMGGGDGLAIEVTNLPQVQGVQTISEEGYLQLPLVGNLLVEGMSAQEIQARLLELYKPYLKEVQVTVRLVQPRPIQITVFGEVTQPDQYRQVLSGGEMRVSQALQLAGGVTTLADITQIRVLRRGAQQKVNLWLFLEKGDLTQDILLREGDVVLVPKLLGEAGTVDTEKVARSTLGNTMLQVRVLGAVAKPSTLSLAPDSVLTVALTAAGGPLAPALPLVLLRADTSGEIRPWLLTVPATSDKNPVLNPDLRTGDVIIVSRPPSDQLQPALPILQELATFVRTLGQGN